MLLVLVKCELFWGSTNMVDSWKFFFKAKCNCSPCSLSVPKPVDEARGSSAAAHAYGQDHQDTRHANCRDRMGMLKEVFQCELWAIQRKSVTMKIVPRYEFCSAAYFPGREARTEDPSCPNHSLS